jgi:site-specific DNA-methyltransferase (adenine-specific)
MLAFGGSRTWHRLAAAVEDAGFEIRDSIAWLYGSGFPKSLNLTNEDGERTGWGTALKPAFEPIVVGRKPLGGTVAANVLQHGTGALNIDACRTATDDKLGGGQVSSKSDGWDRPWKHDADAVTATLARGKASVEKAELLGRWPTNVLLDGSQAEALDQQSGTSQSRVGQPRGSSSGDGWGMTATGAEYSDSGGASRFFPTFHYEAKAPTSERPRGDGGEAHPTVKPLELMRWLVRLVTPVGGVVLDPFAGSGTTAEACIIGGFQCITIERDSAYLPLIVKRISKPIQPEMFGEAAS